MSERPSASTRRTSVPSRNAPVLVPGLCAEARGRADVEPVDRGLRVRQGRQHTGVGLCLGPVLVGEARVDHERSSLGDVQARGAADHTEARACTRGHREQWRKSRRRTPRCRRSPRRSRRPPWQPASASATPRSGCSTASSSPPGSRTTAGCTRARPARCSCSTPRCTRSATASSGPSTPGPARHDGAHPWGRTTARAASSVCSPTPSTSCWPCPATGPRGSLVALALSDGARAWSTPLPEGLVQLVAADGRLIGARGDDLLVLG